MKSVDRSDSEGFRAWKRLLLLYVKYIYECAKPIINIFPLQYFFCIVSLCYSIAHHHYRHAVKDPRVWISQKKSSHLDEQPTFRRIYKGLNIDDFSFAGHNKYDKPDIFFWFESLPYEFYSSCSIFYSPWLSIASLLGMDNWRWSEK